MSNLKVIVEISARHIHLSQEHLDILFGKDYKLTHKKDLSQPGQFACEERVKVEGTKGSFPGISVLGPVRPQTQLEISLADARTLGVPAVIRESGDLAGSPGVKLTGPCGVVELQDGVIVAKRHVHVTPDAATEFGIIDKEIVQVKVSDTERPLIFDEVIARVSPTAGLAMHIDVDEGNAALVKGDTMGEVIRKV